MKIKNFFGKIVDFTLKRLAELVGLLLVIISILLFLSLISYSPEDPNFIFPENTKINNILGSKGSFASDIFYQSIGLISILIPFTIFFTGINIFRNKSFLKIIENIFFIIIYSILGSLFFSIFHEKTFWLTINGNNGFLGNLFQDSFLINDPVGREFNDYFGLLESREEWRADEENDPKSVAKWKAVQGAE